MRSWRGKGIVAQVAYVLAILITVAILFWVAGTLLDPEAQGKPLAWAALAAVPILVVIAMMRRRRNRVSLDESLPSRR